MIVNEQNLALASRAVNDAFDRADARCWWFWFRTKAAISQAREEFKRADRLADVLRAMPPGDPQGRDYGGWTLYQWLLAILMVLSIIPTFGLIFSVILVIFELINLGRIEGPWYHERQDLLAS